MSDEAWCQAQLGLNSGGLGLRSLSLHSSSAFIASFCSSGMYDTDDIHLTNALDHFNSTVAPIEKLSVNSVVSSPVSQKLLSSKVNDYCFQVLFDQSSPANKARLLSVSAPHATSWLSVIPSTSLALHLDPIEFSSCQVVARPRYLLGFSVCFLPCPQSGPSWTPCINMQMWG